MSRVWGEVGLFEVEGRTQRGRERRLLRGEEKADVHAQFLHSNGLDVVARYDRFMIDAVGRPTDTSVCSPRLVDVIGATVTQARNGRTSSRVRTTTGRSLSVPAR